MSNKKSFRRALTAGTNDIAFLVLIVGILILANVLLRGQSTWRADLTEEGLYTLTDSSQELVAGLPDKVTIRAFFSEDLGPPDHNLAQRVEDLLNEYAAHSNGKVVVEMIYPSSEDDDKIAEGYGIRKVPVGNRDANQVSLRLVHKGIAITYGDQTEVIGEVKSSDNLEYNITKSIKTLVYEEVYQVGLVTGHGGPSDSPQFVQSMVGAFDDIYSDLISATTHALSEPVPEEIQALVLLNLTTPLSSVERFHLDQFLMRGGGVAIFQSPSAPDPKMPNVPFRQPLAHGLNSLLSHYGIELRSDVLLDRTRNVVGIALSNQGLVQVSIPTLPILSDINKESVLTKSLDSLVFPHSGTIATIDEVLSGHNLEVGILVESSDTSVRKEGVADVNIEALQEPGEGEIAGPHVVALTIDGEFPSAFVDGPPDGVEYGQKLRSASDPGAHILVVSNGEFMFPNPQSGYTKEYAGFGGLFFLNAMDWLVQDESLIKIRNKGVPRILEPIEEDEKRWLQILNIGGIPFGVALFGLLWFGVQRRRRRHIASQFAPTSDPISDPTSDPGKR